MNNLGTGVADFFYEPAKGWVKSPKDFGEGKGPTVAGPENGAPNCTCETPVDVLGDWARAYYTNRVPLRNWPAALRKAGLLYTVLPTPLL